MDIQSLRLKGAVGIKKGMGLDEISLDFSNMGGMIALTAPTGTGKSTILECLQPYPQLISRPQPALKNHFFLRDSIKELIFNHNGDLWKTVIKIDSESGRTEGYIYVNGSGKSENDGKITTYKDIITKEFGSIELFTNSVFAAQNSPKMSSIQQGDLKKLFVEFLGERLEKLVRYEEAAKSFSNIVLSSISVVDRDIDKYAETVTRYAGVKEDMVNAEGKKAYAELDIKNSEHEIDALQVNLEEANKKLLSLRNDQEKIYSIRKEITTIDGEIKAIEAEKADESKELNAAIDAIENDIDKNRDLLNGKAEIEAAAGREKKLTEDLNEREIILKELQASKEITSKAIEAKRNKFRDAQEDANAKQGVLKDKKASLNLKLQELESDIKRVNWQIGELADSPKLKILSHRLETLKNTACDLDKRGTVHCETYSQSGPLNYSFDCNSEDCPFVEKALIAQKQIPEVEKEIEAVTAENHEQLKAFRERITGLEAEKNNALDGLRKYRDDGLAIADEFEKKTDVIKADAEKLEEGLKVISEKISVTDYEISRLKLDIAAAKELSSKLPEIQKAEQAIDNLTTSREFQAKQLERAMAGYSARIAAKKQKIFELYKEVEELQAGIDIDIERKVADIDRAIKDKRFTINVMRDSLKEIDADIVGLKRDLEAYNEASQKLASLKSRRIYLSTEQSEWEYMKVKCGANGLRALEINSVAPSITHDANSLLEKAFGAWAMVDFQTLDDEGREVLRPMVIDQDGEQVLVANRSGGQQVWAMKALRLAMTGVSKEKSGKDYKTAYADEDDAGLDVETAQNFTKLYRAFLDQGGFNKVFYISHKRECVELADHIIRLNAGGVQ